VQADGGLATHHIPHLPFLTTWQGLLHGAARHMAQRSAQGSPKVMREAIATEVSLLNQDGKHFLPPSPAAEGPHPPRLLCRLQTKVGNGCILTLPCSPMSQCSGTRHLFFTLLPEEGKKNRKAADKHSGLLR